MYAATKSPTCLRVFSERARVDDGIRWIGIHVGIGKEIPMHSNGSRLERGDASKGFGILWFAGRSKGHGMGKNGRAIQTHGHAALEIGRDNEGQLGRFLQPVEQVGGYIGIALEQDGTIHRNGHDQRSDVILADVVAQLNEDGVGVIQELRQHLDAEELADFFFGRHLAQRLVGPLLAGFVEMDGTGLLKAVFVFVFGLYLSL